MKKVLVLILGLIPFFGYGQIYSSTMYFDKYDDLVSEKNEKTLIEKTDSTFIIDTKGKTPKVYYIINYAEYNSAGDKDNIVNLTANVYGYQESWCVIKNEDKDAYIKACIEWYNKTADKIKPGEEISKENVDKYKGDLTNELSKYWLFVVHRVITTQYSHTYESEYFWIQDETSTKLGENINRIIYKK